MANVRQRAEVLAFGVAAVLFLPGVAYLGITNGHQFIADDFFVVMYCWASVTVAAIPMMMWHHVRGRNAGPGFVRSVLLPWLFTTGQGVAYSSPCGDASTFVLILGWGAFVYAGMVALYLLGRALWGIDDHQPAPGASRRAPEVCAVEIDRQVTTTDASAYAAPADRSTPGGGIQSEAGAGLPLRPGSPGRPCCYETWLDGVPHPREGFTNQEHNAWADALAEELRVTFPGVGLQLGVDSGPYLVLFELRVPESDRGNGLGTSVMEHLIAAADLRGVPITLSPSDKLGGDVVRLHGFYQRLGFFDNIVRGKFNAGRESMVRVPRNFAATAQLPPGSVCCCDRA